MPLDPPVQRMFDLVGEAQGPQPTELGEWRRLADETMLLASTELLA